MRGAGARSRRPRRSCSTPTRSPRGTTITSIGALEVSPDNALAGLLRGHRRPAPIHAAIQESGAAARCAAVAIPDVEADLAWANDNRTVLYVEKDPETLLGCTSRNTCSARIPRSDALVFEQTDKSFYTGVSKSKSERFIFIHMESTVSSEWRYADADDPALRFKIFLPHERDHEYQIEHLGDDFIIRTNWQARNFRLMRVPDRRGSRPLRLARCGRASRRCLHRGLRRVRRLPGAVGAQRRTAPRSASCPGRPRRAARQPVLHRERGARLRHGARRSIRNSTPICVRYTYSSLTTPTTVYDYDMRTGEQVLLKRDPVLGNFDPADYRTEFLFAPARDGTQDSGVAGVPQGIRARRHGAAAAIRLWRLRPVHRPELSRPRA